ncbi:MAG: helix-turn-helix domain-containing protein [Lachnospiraceae bacterium]
MITIAFEEEEYRHRQRLKDSMAISSAGHFKLVSREKKDTNRKNNPDYLLLYVAEGALRFYIDDKELILPAGHMYLYQPNAYHHFTYYLEDHPDVYWIHFFEGYLEDTLKNCGFTHEGAYHVGNSIMIENLFNNIIQGYYQNQPHRRKIAEHYLHIILYEMSNGMQLQSMIHDKPGLLNHQIENDISYFYHHYQDSFHIRDYAKMQNVSINWFITRFKNYTGKTPLQFLNDIRIDKAKNLLISKYFTTDEITHMVGFEDSDYFTRLFKRHEGVTPSQYRKNSLEAKHD